MAAQLEYVEARVSSLSPVVRKEIISTAKRVVETESDLDPLLGQCAKIINATLAAPINRQCQKDVESFIVLLCKKSPKFAVSFAKFIAATFKKTPSGAYDVHFTLLSWICLLIENGFDVKEKTWPSLRDSLTSLLDCVLGLPVNKGGSIDGRLARCLAKNADMCDSLIEHVKTGESLAVVHLAGVLACIPAVLDKHRGVFCDTYQRLMLGGKGRPLKAHHMCFRPLLETLTMAEFEATFPAVERILKRSPETAVALLATLISLVTIDLSAVARKTLFPLVSPFLRDEKADRREASVDCVRGLVMHTTDVDVVLGMLEDIGKLLGGSKGNLSYPYQRTTHYLAIECFLALKAEVPRREEVLASTAAILVRFIGKEKGHDEARFCALSILGQALKLGAPVQPDVLACYEEGLSAKKNSSDVSRAAYLKSLVDACAANADRFKPLAGAVVKLFLDGQKQAALQAEAILAARVLVDIAAHTDLDAEMADVWPLLLSTTGSLTSVPRTGVADDDAVPLALVGTVALLRTAHADRLGDADCVHALSGAVVDVLLHESWKSHFPARRVVQDMVTKVPKASADLLAAFPSRLNQTSSGSAPLSQRVWRKALKACVGKEAVESFSAATAVTLVLAATHPRVVPEEDSHVVVNELAAIHGDALVGRLLDVPTVDAIKAAVMGDDGLLSSNTLARANALQLFRALVSAPAGAWTHGALDSVLVGAALALMDATEYDSVKAKEWQIHACPSGMLVAEALAEAAKQEEERIRQRDKSRKNQDDDDDDWERENAARKKGKDKKQPTKAERAEREAALQAEDAVRTRVAAILSRLRAGLDALSVAGQANPSAMHDMMPKVLPVVLSMVERDHIAEEAAKVVFTLATCLSEGMRAVSAVVAAVVVRHRNDGRAPAHWRQEERNKQVRRAVEALADKTARGAPLLSATSVLFAFSAFEAVLYNAAFPPEVHEQAVKFISRHASLGAELPRADITRVLFHVMEGYPRLEDAAHAAVLSLWTGRGSCDYRAVLKGVLSPSMRVRKAAVEAIKAAGDILPADPEVERAAVLYLWLARQDATDDKGAEEEVAKVVALANEVWEDAGLTMVSDFDKDYLDLLAEPDAEARVLVGRGFAAAVREYPSRSVEVVTALLEQYKATLHASTAKKTIDYSRAFDDAAKEEATALRRLYVRSGTAACIHKLAGCLDHQQMEEMFSFLLNFGLCDPNDDIRTDFQDAGVNIILEQGAASVDYLFPVFELELQKPASNEKEDMVREGLVVFLGTLAKHLKPEDPKVVATLEKLLDALLVPSATVQIAVAKCLPGLMPAVKNDAEKYINMLLDRLLKDPNFGHRKGAAHGLAGMVKGLTLSSLGKYQIMERLEAAIQDKKDADAREGALLAFEAFSRTLGRLFEPYVVPTSDRNVMTHLLDRFGDPSANVRDAVQDAAKTIMEQLTGRGVKRVLPMLLEKLEDDAWRTKLGGVQILGTMAFCAPKQLSQCLPMVAPKLVAVLSDPHAKVSQAAKESLEGIGSVIKNPEIQVHVKIILNALVQPDKGTPKALEALLYTSFVHRIDAASLALLVPILHRGLKDRGGETKKKAARIVGNMCTLTDKNDLLPYLDILVPDLKQILVDPIPEVRSVAARALGSLVTGMGEENFVDLIPWLVETLKSDAGSVERSGAAQGLSEVLGGLGVAHFDAMLPDLAANTNHQRAIIREGFFNIFVFIPPIFGDDFQPYIGQVLPCVLRGLADESEFVRDTAFRAGQVLVNNFGASSLKLLLPALEDGLFDDNWRIRQSSVSLLGDLLYMISGVTGNIQVNQDDSDDEGISNEAQGKAILRVLGAETRARVLSSLYMARLDVQAIVRQAAMQVWKQIVAHTARTLREILPVLMDLLIAHLASVNPDKRQVAGRTLGDIVKKLGPDRVLPDIIPILEAGLDDSDADKRQGVCLGLSEVMASAGKAHTGLFIDQLLPAVRKALCDVDEDVREASAQAFDILYGNVGWKALDDILPQLLESLDDDGDDDDAGEGEGSDDEAPTRQGSALDGLRQILSVRANVVLPYLVPKLIDPELTAFNCRALAALAEVGGQNLPRHLTTIFPPLLAAMSSPDDATAAAAADAARAVVVSIPVEGSDILVRELTSALKTGGPAAAQMRGHAARLVGHVFTEAQYSLDDHAHPLLRSLLELMYEPDPAIGTGALEGLTAVCESLRKEEQISYVPFIRQCVARIREDHPAITSLPGFNLPKGLDPLLPIFQQGLMYGSPEMREAAALGFGELIDLVESENMKPYIKNVAGPLIRIFGDRFAWEVKAAILSTLCLLIKKAGLLLKAFVPQLQTTLIKALSDPTKMVRQRASAAMGLLAPLHSRVDLLATEVHKQLAACSDDAIRETLLSTLAKVYKAAGSKATEKSRGVVRPTLLSLLDAETEGARVAAARAVACLCRAETGDNTNTVLDEVVSGRGKSQLHGCTAALASTLQESASCTELAAVLETKADGIINHVMAASVDQKEGTRKQAARAAGQLVVQTWGGDAASTVMPLLASLVTDPSVEVQVTALRALKNIAKNAPDVSTPAMSATVPKLMAATRDKEPVVRQTVERTLLYTLRVPEGSAVLDSFVAGADAKLGKDLLEYNKRVLAKIMAKADYESDSEDEEDI